MVTKKLVVGGTFFTITMQVGNGSAYKAEIITENGVKSVELRLIYWDALSHHIIFELHNKRYEARLKASHDQDSHLSLLSDSIYFFKSKKEFTIEIPFEKNKVTHSVSPAVALIKKRESVFNSQPVLKSPLGGRVVRVLVQPGAMVIVNQPLLVIESMKMENELCSPYDAIVKTLSIVQGNLVKSNEVLITFEKKGDGDAASKSKYEQEEIQDR